MVKVNKIKEFELKSISRNCYISEMENCVSFDKYDNKIVIDKYNLKSIYVLYDDYDNFPYIIKCPVIESGKYCYTINTKHRKRNLESSAIKFISQEKYTVKKNMIDRDIYISSSYNIALSRLLEYERTVILKQLEETNNKSLYKLFIEATKKGSIFGLEFIARELNMDYMFKLDDDTKENFS